MNDTITAQAASEILLCSYRVMGVLIKYNMLPRPSQTTDAILFGRSDIEAFLRDPMRGYAACRWAERASETEKVGKVYFVGAPEVRRIKIGFSDNPIARLRDLSTSSPVKLGLIGFMYGAIEHERKAHDIFRRQRFNGEWFNSDPDLTSFIRQRCVELDESQLALVAA